MNVFITGVSRGIGLALAQEALEKGYRVIGIARHPEASSDVKKLQDRFDDKLQLVAVDLMDPAASEKLAQAVRELPQIDVLINNAGVFESGESKADFLKSFEVNSYTPFMVTQSLLPKLKAAKAPKVIHVTSLMGSIAENHSGGYYAYRASKAALNMIHKCLTVDHPWLSCLVVHPGWVKTRMGGENAPVDPQNSARGIWKDIEALSLQGSGGFKDYEGKDLPW